MRFKDYFLCEGDKQPNFCYMLYLEPPYTEYIQAIQQSISLQAAEIIKPEDYHCTVRYCQLNPGQTSLAFLEWLSNQPLPELSAFTAKFSMFNDGALVMELDAPEIHEWFEKVNGHLTHLGYAKSDFPTYKPHISIAYNTTSPLPQFDARKHRVKVKFTKHIVTNQNKEIIFEKRSDKALGVGYASQH